MRRRPFVSVLATAVIVALTACSSGSDAVCVASESGEVCADGGDGQITFRGRGLEPGSEVRMENDKVGPIVLLAEADGSLDPNGTTGVMALFAGTEFTFTVTATDDQGAPIVGDLTVST
ncbi:MAG TPA: hypothetical protein VMY16_01575 [Ilumatobacteraceae bacterium]|nr:hypothetical protein [Ilumatobacteraceae bacterium]